MEWLTGIEIAIGLVVLCPVLFLSVLFIRRRWLSGRGGVFDCAMKVSGTPAGWALGMARYNGDRLEWYRVFSLSFRPKYALKRSETSWASQRTPEPEESMVLFTDHQVVALRGVDRRGRERIWELAMTPASVTGLMSWLEAAPPGVSYPTITP